MRTHCIAFTLVFATACSSEKDKPVPSTKDMVDEASVDFARQQLPKLDAILASASPGDAYGTCSVIKPDLSKVRKVDPKLADMLERRCGRDLTVRQLTLAVERAEGAPSECDRISMYDDSIAKLGVETDEEVVKLRARAAAACKKD